MSLVPKRDVNKIEWEDVEFPSICERCLGDNSYVRMTREPLGQECKICSRPCTIFRWSSSRERKRGKTQICVGCARLKNCCQACMLDLQFGLPIALRDAALKMVDSGPTNDINREFFAQNQQRLLKNEETPYDSQESNAVARNLVRKTERREPYQKPARRKLDEQESKQLLKDAKASDTSKSSEKSLFPIKKIVNGRVLLSIDMEPPKDKKIASLFIMGVEDELPDYKIRKHFEQYGPLKSVVCSHRAKCAFVNYKSRLSAEIAAASCPNGDLSIEGFRLKAQWGKPRSLGGPDQETRNAKLADLVMHGKNTPEKSSNSEQSFNEADGAASSSAPTAAVAQPISPNQPKYPSQNTR
ncbi:Prp19 complex subunit, RNA-binding Cwf5 [Schizosaccharomyces osmophilus]|uniref:Prp19 complex subunit, RNA-binding Cwf5 n=1 Tax=Schizosaccharomyces osmophilus TaxID=2545709 RepID=A0AAE9WFA7_9SCHI|nr:Prp19 complex subunit, RNA-binding Cwf5 [Schizosaccharomyces osmophilus]WBW75120.1 Prp19 complex subunit, RNA-binding Cwf5 [Schizosaccharomyces osmophilus]